MKKLLILLFPILLSFNSYGEWKKIFTNNDGETFYIDFDRIKEHNGHVYWWGLKDYLVPKDGILSDMYYHQGDCENNRFKSLSVFYFERSMGEGVSYSKSDSLSTSWYKPKTGGIAESLLIIVCDYRQ